MDYERMSEGIKKDLKKHDFDDKLPRSSQYSNAEEVLMDNTAPSCHVILAEQEMRKKQRELEEKKLSDIYDDAKLQEFIKEVTKHKAESDDDDDFIKTVPLTQEKSVQAILKADSKTDVAAIVEGLKDIQLSSHDASYLDTLLEFEILPEKNLILEDEAKESTSLGESTKYYKSFWDNDEEPTSTNYYTSFWDNDEEQSIEINKNMKKNEVNYYTSFWDNDEQESIKINEYMKMIEHDKKHSCLICTLEQIDDASENLLKEIETVLENRPENYEQINSDKTLIADVPEILEPKSHQSRVNFQENKYEKLNPSIVSIIPREPLKSSHDKISAVESISHSLKDVEFTPSSVTIKAFKLSKNKSDDSCSPENDSNQSTKVSSDGKMIDITSSVMPQKSTISFRHEVYDEEATFTMQPEKVEKSPSDIDYMFGQSKLKEKKKHRHDCKCELNMKQRQKEFEEIMKKATDAIERIEKKSQGLDETMKNVEEKLEVELKESLESLNLKSHVDLKSFSKSVIEEVKSAMAYKKSRVCQCEVRRALRKKELEEIYEMEINTELPVTAMMKEMVFGRAPMEEALNSKGDESYADVILQRLKEIIFGDRNEMPTELESKNSKIKSKIQNFENLSAKASKETVKPSLTVMHFNVYENDYLSRSNDRMATLSEDMEMDRLYDKVLMMDGEGYKKNIIPKVQDSVDDDGFVKLPNVPSTTLSQAASSAWIDENITFMVNDQAETSSSKFPVSTRKSSKKELSPSTSTESSSTANKKPSRFRQCKCFMTRLSKSIIGKK